MSLPAEQKRKRVLNSVRRARGRFVESLVDRILDLEGLAVDLERDPTNEENLKLVAAQTHRMAGVAGNIGFAEIGSRSIEIEWQIKEQLKTETPEVVWKRVATSLEGLLNIMEAALEEQS